MSQRVKRYGRRFYIWTPRLLVPLSFDIQGDLLPRWLTLGVYAGDDEDGEVWVTFGLLLVEVRLHPVRHLTRRQLARRRDEAATRWAPGMVDEVEDFLKGGKQ